jgi:hypothetical protein
MGELGALFLIGIKLHESSGRAMIFDAFPIRNRAS